MNDGEDARERDVRDNQRDVASGAGILHGQDVPGAEVVQGDRFLPGVDADGLPEYAL